MQPLERIGRYRLERRLGTGAFGTVWLAHDDQLDASVAVKVLADNWSHRLDIHDRFLSEARLLRRADSKRVVQVYDIGELPDGRPYFVMEYADAGTLPICSPVARSRSPDALRLTALAARGAADLHEAGDRAPGHQADQCAAAHRAGRHPAGAAGRPGAGEEPGAGVGAHPRGRFGGGTSRRSRPSPARASTRAPTSTRWARWATSWSPGRCRRRPGRSYGPSGCGRTWGTMCSGR